MPKHLIFLYLKFCKRIEHQLNKTTGLQMRARALNDIFMFSFSVVHIHVPTYSVQFPSLCKKLPSLAFLLNIETKESFQHLCTAALESVCIFPVLSSAYIPFEKHFQIYFHLKIRKFNCYCQRIKE